MSTHDFEAAIIARMTARQTDPADPGTRHLLHDLQMGQVTTAAEFAEIEACERHVPTAVERQAYREAVERYDAVAGGPDWDSFVRDTLEQGR